MRKQILIALIAFLSSLSGQAQVACPIGPTKTSPQVSVKVDYDKKSGIFRYSYTVSNRADAPIPIRAFKLKLDERSIELIKPDKWAGSFDVADATMPSHLVWSTVVREIQPGASQSGFVIKTRHRPGLVKYFVDGRTDEPVSTTVNGDPEAFPDCPDFFFDKPPFESMTTGMIEGPAPSDQISVKIKIKKGKDKEDRKHDRKSFRPYQETGLITLVLKGSKEFDVGQVELSSIRLGMGKAPIVWSEFRPGVDDDDKDDDHESRRAKKLWLQFNLDQVDIECDRDRVLFLEGKTKDGKSILGGAEITAKDCEKPPTNPRRKMEHERRKKQAGKHDEE